MVHPEIQQIIIHHMWDVSTDFPKLLASQARSGILTAQMKEGIPTHFGASLLWDTQRVSLLAGPGFHRKTTPFSGLC